LRPSESLVLAYLGHVTRNLAITFNFAIFGYLLSKSFQESLSLASGRSWTVSELWIVPRFSQPKQDIAHCQHRLDGPWSTTDCHWPHIFHVISRRCMCDESEEMRGARSEWDVWFFWMLRSWRSYNSRKTVSKDHLTRAPGQVELPHEYHREISNFCLEALQSRL
jgi:hypothetical protein